jgi:hypothetical protein
MTTDERARLQAKSVAEMTTRLNATVVRRRAPQDARDAEPPTRPLSSGNVPFEETVGPANVVRSLAVIAGQLAHQVDGTAARSLVEACDVRRCPATGLATTAALNVVPDAALAELRSELRSEDALVRFDAALVAMRVIRDEQPHVFVAAQAAVREAHRAFSDGAFAALDGAPCKLGGAFAVGHRAVSHWLRNAPETVSLRVVREARLDRDGGYWARLRGRAVDPRRYDVSAAYRAGVAYAEQVLASRGQR